MDDRGPALVERVARAIYDAVYTPESWSEEPNQEREWAFQQADAAIAAYESVKD